MATVNTLVLASGNAGKLREFNQLLSPLGFDVRPQADFGVSEVEETGLTFVENALLKAREASRISGLPALADDSGLEVDALQGAPGIYSARYGGEPKSDDKNNQKLLAALSDCAEGQRSGRYWCEILAHPRGQEGFGYDPLFWLPDQGMSVAELPSETKNRLSHRGRALQGLVELLKVAHG